MCNRLGVFLVVGGWLGCVIRTFISGDWTIPQLDKLLNSKAIWHSWKELPKFSEVVKFGCKIL